MPMQSLTVDSSAIAIDLKTLWHKQGTRMRTGHSTYRESDPHLQASAPSLHGQVSQDVDLAGFDGCVGPPRQISGLLPNRAC